MFPLLSNQNLKVQFQVMGRKGNGMYNVEGENQYTHPLYCITNTLLTVMFSRDVSLSLSKMVFCSFLLF